MTTQTKKTFQFKQMLIWLAALIIGAVLGSLGIAKLNEFFNFIAAVFTNLFQFVAVPTIAIAVLSTLATLGAKKETGKIFLNTCIYTFLTTLAASLVALALYLIIAPGNLPAEIVTKGATSVPGNLEKISYYNHILSVIPNNLLKPLISGNVLSILIIAAAAGLGLAAMKDSENKATLLKGILGLQELLFVLIKALVFILPIGVVAFSAQLASQLSSGVIVGSLGKYLLVILGGNFIQFFIVLPIFLLIKGLNPIKVFKGMLPAVLMALFTKSSAATLPVTIESAETNLNVNKSTSRFVLPICCTINMNGCAAYILVTSLFVMQHSNITLTVPTLIMWVAISVISAIGNAGVPMGCYFLTLSLMAGINAPIGIMGILLPIFAVIDMIETAENVWSDGCVCSIVNKNIYGKTQE
jgi:Na+/H+-dicarboxylate symporter